MKKILCLCLGVAINYVALAGDTLKVLFIGNSYTATYNIPNIIGNMANASGDVLIQSSHTPGGRKFSEHSSDPVVWNLMNQDKWDFVVLQEQSQLPSFPDPDVNFAVYPHAKTLDSLIQVSNECARTLFYNTWGRKNGDAGNCGFFPPLCTYEGMDSMLYLRYTKMAEDNEASISPVARLWRYIRNNHPSIDLYSGDESHPSMAGSFAAAATFYAMIYEKDPSLLNYHGGLTSNEAQIILNAAKLVVFDSIDYWTRFDKNYIQPNFEFNVGNASVSFQNMFNRPGFNYEWTFGDGGQNSTQENPTHSYNAGGTYNVCLTIFNDCYSETICKDVVFTSDDTTNSIKNVLLNTIKIYPNPVHTVMHIEEEYNNSEFTIYDVLGKVVKAGIIKNAHIDVKELNEGMYLLMLQNKDKVFQQRFTKQ